MHDTICFFSLTNVEHSNVYFCHHIWILNYTAVLGIEKTEMKKKLRNHFFLVRVYLKKNMLCWIHLPCLSVCPSDCLIFFYHFSRVFKILILIEDYLRTNSMAWIWNPLSRSNKIDLGLGLRIFFIVFHTFLKKLYCFSTDIVNN
jgi:hypothetical protein